MRCLKVASHLIVGFLCFLGSWSLAFAQPVNSNEAAPSQIISLQDGDLSVTWHPQTASSNVVLTETPEVVASETAASVPSTNSQVVVVIVNRKAHPTQSYVEPVQALEVDQPEMPTDSMFDATKLEKSWKRGFDMRLNIAADFKYFVHSDETALDLGLGADIGYRWPYVGLYLYLNLQSVFFDGSIGIRTLFFVPMTENLELVLGLGLAVEVFGAWIPVPLSVGLAWHLGNMSIGFDLIYEPFIPLIYDSDWDYEDGFVHDFRMGISIGYTF